VEGGITPLRPWLSAASPGQNPRDRQQAVASRSPDKRSAIRLQAKKSCNRRPESIDTHA
jgi:hypothetical protein